LRKELKEQIREDEFRTGLAQAAAWIRANEGAVRLGVGLAVAAAAIALGVRYYADRRDGEAREAFARALSTFQAPVASELPAGSALPPQTFATPAEKYRKAAAEFDGLERRFASNRLAGWSRYYAALARVELGERAAAEKALEALGSAPGNELIAGLARLAAAECARRAGNLDEAISRLRKLADDPTVVLPRDAVLIALAAAQEEARRFPEARSSYERLVERFPASVYAGEARRKADLLKLVS
jgi:tetratricopeptide (TPR) repeat protein